jgi:two-component system response regulator FixJ
MPGTIKPICILDDDTSVLSSLQQLLDSDGYQALAFDKADEFLAYVQWHPVRLAVLDIWMPEMNGIEVQERLHELSPKTQVIVITGREEAAIRIAAINGGAIAFLSKPFDDEAFLTAVRGALSDGA